METSAQAAPIAPKQINISQSLLKSLFDYASGKECGLRFKAAYIDKISFPPTDSMKIGLYFEYLCTGVLPRDGVSHEPELRKDGKLTAPYERMRIQAERFKKTMAAYNIEILEVGKELKFENKKGIADVLMKFNGHKAILDIKSSGLIGNRWEDMGWEIESLPDKDKIMIQVIFYKWLWRKLHNEDIPFYFLVFSNTNEYDCLFLEVEVDEERFEKKELERAMENAGKILNSAIEKGFRPLPDVKRCAECMVKSTCSHYTEVPILKKVYY